jgi:hypothetical protein
MIVALLVAYLLYEHTSHDICFPPLVKTLHISFRLAALPLMFPPLIPCCFFVSFALAVFISHYNPKFITAQLSRETNAAT